MYDGEITLCPECHGNGVIWKGLYQGYDWKSETCPVCLGRRVVKVKLLPIEPEDGHTLKFRVR